MNKKPIGVHAHRLSGDNPREKAFVEAWKNDDFLELLSRVNCNPDDPQRWNRTSNTNQWYRKPIGVICKRDRIIAETVIQWLGSNIGMEFLERVLNKLGYKLTKI